MEAVENISTPIKEDQKFELPPGFRFHPTDEELITHYLSEKVLDNCFCSIAVTEVDLNKCEPWDLPWKAKMGEKEWYFFCLRDRKYPTGLRTNRATHAGYWKATGKDKEIYKAKTLVGMKKTLVFYKGKAPKGEKTNWVMHEYRLEGKHSKYNLPKTAKNEWAICRVFQKSSCGMKMQIPGLVRFSSFGKELPPLMDSSSQYNNNKTKTIVGELSQDDNIVESFQTPMLASSYFSNPSDFSSESWDFTKVSPTVTRQSTQIAHQIGNSQYPDCFMVQEQSSMLKMLIENHGTSTKQKNEKSQERDFDADVYNNEMFQTLFGNQEFSSASAGNVDAGFHWNC